MKMGRRSACWLWLKSRNNKGYGKLRYQGKPWVAHRLAWSLERGPVPDGMFVCHHCDNPPCCNPEHLFLGTAKDNMQDALNKGRVQRRPERQLNLISERTAPRRQVLTIDQLLMLLEDLDGPA